MFDSVRETKKEMEVERERGQGRGMEGERGGRKACLTLICHVISDKTENANGCR